MNGVSAVHLETRLLRERSRALRAQAAALRAQARSLAGRSRSVRDAAEFLHECLAVNQDASRLVTRCAWCGRYFFARKWRSAEAVERHVAAGRDAARTTHSICPLCAQGTIAS